MVKSASGTPRMVFRRELDRRSVLRGAAALGLAGAVSGAYRWRAEAGAQADTTADLMNFARTMEGLLCKAYEHVLDEGNMTPRDDELLRPIMQHEMGYVEQFGQLVRKAGGSPVELPMYNFSEEEMVDRAGCLRTLSSLEELSLKGWHGQIPNVTDPTLTKVMRPVLMAKARHAAVVAMLMEDEGKPFPAPIEGSIMLEEALDGMAQYRGAA
jgi:hypothetical protein